MDTQAINTPNEAFQSLRDRALWGLSANPPAAVTELVGYLSRMEQFQETYMAPDQSVAYPGYTRPLAVTLLVIAYDDGRLVLQTTARWQSIYGLHVSSALYSVTRNDAVLNIKAGWTQQVPTPTLSNMDIHTGGVSAQTYHDKVVGLLYEHGSVVCKMLQEDTSGDSAAYAERLVAIARAVVDRPALL